MDGDRLIDVCPESTLQRLKLIEWLHTSVFLVDDRVEAQLKARPIFVQENTTWKNLRLIVKNEKLASGAFSRMHEKRTDKFHFIVVHLSFLERLQRERNAKSIAAMLKGLWPNEEPFRFLVITTGRGRTQWFTELENSLPGRLLFLPPEALTSAIAHAVQLGDDLEVKLAITATLLGS